MPKGTILVIDDAKVILDVVSEILKKADYQPETARSGDEGYEKLKKGTFDLVMTDIKMPGLSGINLIEKIRTKISTELPIIVITGHGTYETAIESMKHGIQVFVMKPFTPAEIIAAVEDALQKSNIVKENTRLKKFFALFEANKRLFSEVDVQKLMELIVEEASKLVGADKGSIFLGEINGRSAKTKTTFQGSSRARVKNEDLAIPLEEEDIDCWFAKKEPYLMNADAEDILAPILTNGRLIGALHLTRKSHQFTKSDLELVSVFCEQAAIAIENARLYEKLKTEENIK